MFLFGNKIEKLEKFIIKALEKAITAGESIIQIYKEANPKVEKLKVLIEKLKSVLKEVKGKNE